MDDMTVVENTLGNDPRARQSTLDEFSEWASESYMKLNPEKTHLLLMGTHRRLSTVNQPVQVLMDDTPLIESKSEQLLGCMVEGNFKWSKHVSSLHSRLKKRLIGLNRLKYV